MKRRIRHKGIRLGSGLIAILLAVVFCMGSAFSSAALDPPADHLQMVIKQDLLNPFVLTPFFESRRPVTGWQTIIWSASTVPGHRPAVEMRCNSPTNTKALDFEM